MSPTFPYLHQWNHCFPSFPILELPFRSYLFHFQYLILKLLISLLDTTITVRWASFLDCEACLPSSLPIPIQLPQCLFFVFVFWVFFFFLAVPHGMWHLSSPTSDRTHTPCTGSAESSPLDRQGSSQPPRRALTHHFEHLLSILQCTGSSNFRPVSTVQHHFLEFLAISHHSSVVPFYKEAAR